MEERKAWGLSSAQIQLIALVTMAIDHLGNTFFPQAVGLRIIGRLAFPLFCLLLAEGFVHTRSKPSYLKRLAGFAVLSVVPFCLYDAPDRLALLGTAVGEAFGQRAGTAPDWAGLVQLVQAVVFENVLFELTAGFLLLWAVSREPGSLPALLGAAVLLLAAGDHLMYGWYGLVMILCLYGLRGHRGGQAAAVALLSGGWYWLFPCLGRAIAAGTGLWGFFTGLLLDPVSVQAFAGLAALPILLYTGERGRRLPRYAAYVFYPAHLLLYAGIDLLLR